MQRTGGHTGTTAAPEPFVGGRLETFRVGGVAICPQRFGQRAQPLRPDPVQQVHGGEVVLELGQAGGAEQRRGQRWMGQRERDAHLGGGGAEFLAERAERGGPVPDPLPYPVRVPASGAAIATATVEAVISRLIPAAEV